jgi:hypothetical protein
MDKQDINWTQATVPDKILSVGNIKPNYNISFHNNGKEVGKLDFNGPALVFTGEAEESAKVFIDWIAQSFAGRLEEERKAEREAFNKERQQYADWLDEAAADIEDWGMYASEYLQKKWDLPDQVQDYKNRAAAIRARENT